jgi:hypothetical protein
MSKTKHVGYYLEDSNQEFDDELDNLLQQLTLTDCINLLRWVTDQIKDLVEDKDK